MYSAHSVRSMVSGVDMLWKRVIIIYYGGSRKIRDNHAKPTARGIDKTF